MTHVIEHIPQLILFFKDISNILNPQGKICLAIPDKRFCFDHFRYPTSFAECYDIYIRGIDNNPFRVLDYLASTVINDPVYWWKDKDSFEHIPKSKNKFNIAKDNYMRALDGNYIDIHFSVFTPESFLLLLYYMVCYNLFPFKCIEFNKTEINSLEFNCVLEFDPNISVEDSIENKKEKENIINLLIENADSKLSMVMIEDLMNKLQNANDNLEMTRNDLQKANDDLEISRNDLQKANDDLEISRSNLQKTNDKLEMTKHDLQNANDDLEMTMNALQAIILSKSWKITAPLRKIKTIYNKYIKK